MVRQLSFLFILLLAASKCLMQRLKIRSEHYFKIKIDL